MEIPDQLTCILRNLYRGQEETVRTGHGAMDWLQIGKGVCHGCILSPCLFNFYAEYIMWNAGLDEAQARIKIARRNTNNLIYTDDTTMLLLLSCFSRVRLCATPQTAAHQAPSSLGFSRQEHWSGLPFPSPMHESEKWKWSRSVVSNSSDPMDYSLPGSSIQGIFQAKVLE